MTFKKLEGTFKAHRDISDLTLSEMVLDAVQNMLLLLGLDITEFKEDRATMESDSTIQFEGVKILIGEEEILNLFWDEYLDEETSIGGVKFTKNQLFGIQREFNRRIKQYRRFVDSPTNYTVKLY